MKKAPTNAFDEPGYRVRVAFPGGDNATTKKMTLGAAVELSKSFYVEGDMEISILPPERSETA